MLKPSFTKSGLTPTLDKTFLSGMRPSNVRATKSRLYDFLDEFTHADGALSAGSHPCVPGPGSLTIVGNKFSITSNKLAWTAGAGAFNNHYATGPGGLVRTAGRMMLGKFTRKGTAGFCKWGYGSTTSPTNTTMGNGFYLTNGPGFALRESASQIDLLPALTADTVYDLALVLKAAGAFYFIKGGTYTDWTLLFISDENTVATLYPELNNFSQAGELDDWRVHKRLWTPTPASESTDPLLNTNSNIELGFDSADYLLDINVTRGNGDGGTTNGIAVYFRVAAGLSGAINNWQIRVFDDGSVVLTKLDNNTPQNTTIFNAGTVAKNQTFTVRMIADGQTFRFFAHRTDSANTTWTASGQNNFAAGSFQQSSLRIFTSGEGDIGPGDNLTVNRITAWRRHYSDSQFPRT